MYTLARQMWRTKGPISAVWLFCPVPRGTSFGCPVNIDLYVVHSTPSSNDSNNPNPNAGRGRVNSPYEIF